MFHTPAHKQREPNAQPGQVSVAPVVSRPGLPPGIEVRFAVHRDGFPVTDFGKEDEAYAFAATLTAPARFCCDCRYYCHSIERDPCRSCLPHAVELPHYTPA